MVWPEVTERVELYKDPFSDDTPLDVESIDLEKPVTSESCQ